MEQRDIELELLAPAFLGDANQYAAWRTPPIKNLLRRWWRVAMAARGMRLADIRYDEGRLFGTAAGNSGERSRVRLRLAEWRKGYEAQWREPTGSGRQRRGLDTQTIRYLAYGRAETTGANNSAIPAGERARLSLAWPKDCPGAEALPDALGLLHRLGALGGRSNNGWGSCDLVNLPEPKPDLRDFARDWEKALTEPWVHAVGRDETGLLLWETTASHSSWDGVMRVLAEVRKALCADAGPLRPLLSWPVTGTERHGGLASRSGDRIPNTLRLRVARTDENELRGQVCHLPCRPADEIWTEKLTEQDHRDFPELWRKAHKLLDDREDLRRVSQ